MHGFGSKLTGAAKKTEQRRLRSYLSITAAEEQPIGAIFAEKPTRQIYLVSEPLPNCVLDAPIELSRRS